MSWTARFKIVWVHWCWCHSWPTFWVIVCHRNGFVGAMYDCLFSSLEISSKGINKDVSHNSHLPEELTPIRALADQLEGTKEEEHKKYRGMVVEYIMIQRC
ncbi:uncharacterized protein LOC115959159 [Quercus lobata]|uniref:uncharacterized protein LOC115959159 n=1 Tax=Quercus lobata TaxID=97700 RepID=UPI001247DE6A|nr:uncharacterized protein LOC115959159 [Quercus lobata]